MVSLLRRISIDELRNLVNSKDSIRDILFSLGYTNNGGVQWRAFKELCANNNIDLTCLSERRKIKRQHKIATSINSKRVPDGYKKYLVDNAPVKSFDRSYLKKKLIKNGLLENKCAICGMLPTWKDKPLVLILDHINGKNDDYRIENLRLVCPNCGSQLETFAGRRFKRKEPKSRRTQPCIQCGKLRIKNAKTGLCQTCLFKSRKNKMPS